MGISVEEVAGPVPKGTLTVIEGRREGYSRERTEEGLHSHACVQIAASNVRVP